MIAYVKIILLALLVALMVNQKITIYKLQNENIYLDTLIGALDMQYLEKRTILDRKIAQYDYLIKVNRTVRHDKLVLERKLITCNAYINERNEYGDAEIQRRRIFQRNHWTRKLSCEEHRRLCSEGSICKSGPKNQYNSLEVPF